MKKGMKSGNEHFRIDGIFFILMRPSPRDRVLSNRRMNAYNALKGPQLEGVNVEVESVNACVLS